MDKYYPESVAALLRDARHSGRSARPDVAGTAVSFGCGVGLEFELDIEEGVLREVNYTSTGCGWAVASAEALARLVELRPLKDLHGLEDTGGDLRRTLGGIPPGRSSCVELAVDEASMSF